MGSQDDNLLELLDFYMAIAQEVMEQYKETKAELEP